jgi:hypothetical protein
MFCRNCGKEIDDKAFVCPHCGVKTKTIMQDDEPIGGLGVLCFFFPVIGLILYLVWQENKPIKSKGAGKSALWGFGIGVALYLLIIIIAAIAATIY